MSEGRIADVTRILSLLNTSKGSSNPNPSAKASVDAVNEHGHTPLMCAAAQVCEDASCAMMHLLLGAHADTATADSRGLTALHWASLLSVPGKAGARVRTLLEARADPNARCALGETPLHAAARLGKAEAICALVQGGADARAQSTSYHTPWDVAGHTGEFLRGAGSAEAGAGGSAACSSVFHADLRGRACEALCAAVPGLRTAVLSHPDCLLHANKEGHQEDPRRVCEILARIGDPALFPAHELNHCTDFAPGTAAQITRAHSKEYYRLVELLARHVARIHRSVPFTPQVRKLREGGGGGGCRWGWGQWGWGLSGGHPTHPCPQPHAK